jgi:hypothetical protein
VRVTSPKAGDHYDCFTRVPFRANASDASGIAKVEYLVNGTPVGESSTPPDFPVDKDIDCGCYNNVSVVAKATDTCGNPNTSASVGPVNACCIVCLESNGETRVPLVSQLDVPEGSGQVVLNGRDPSYVKTGRSILCGQRVERENHVEAILVSAVGRPGSWRFVLSGAKPGSLRVIAGQVVMIGSDEVVFRLSGRAGERVVFTFHGK